MPISKENSLFPDPRVRSPYNERDSAACGLIGFINKDRKRVSGEIIKKAITNQHDRGNGLGGGFAGYGIYPQFKDLYALHLMYDKDSAIPEVEDILRKNLSIAHQETIPHKATAAIRSHPLFKRYFVDVPTDAHGDRHTPDDYMVSIVLGINEKIDGAFVISSGKNMGAFKGVGFPEDIADFFGLEQYEGYIWTAHNRFPTNTPGWWGGAHPFSILDWSIVHNGEISSYGINYRFIDAHGYPCTMMTDTEVVTYIMDFLIRKHKLSFEDACSVMAPPFWKDIDVMPEDKKHKFRLLRATYGSASLNGPFAFLFGFNGGLIALNDRVKLRPLVVGRKGKTVYIASEEASIREICPDLDSLYAPRAGQPTIEYLEEEKINNLIAD